MKRLLILSGLVLGAAQLATAQLATFTPGAVSNITTTGSMSFGTSGLTVAINGTGPTQYNGSSSRSFTVNNAVSGVNNRFNISVDTTLTGIATTGLTQNASVSVSGAGAVTRNLSTTSSTTVTSTFNGRTGSASATAVVSGAVAPLALGSVSTASVATAGSPLMTLQSTPTHWVFDFPGDPATGTATINLGNVSANFSRALDSIGGLSLHRDNVRIEVTAFLDGIQVGTTKVSGINTTLSPLAGTGSNAIVFNSIPGVTLNPGDLYNQTRALTVVTKLVGTSFLGNTTSLGDYTIAQSTFSGVTLQGVPEPATIAGLSLGLLAIARRRKSK